MTLNGDLTPGLLGACNPFERACWGALAVRTCATLREVCDHTGLPETSMAPTLSRLLAQRVAVAMPGDQICELSTLARAR
mgnify:CR=1 FL=1